MRVRLTFFSAIGMGLLLLSCTQIPITDEPWFGSLGPTGAYGFHTLTNEIEDLTLPQWAAKWDDLSNPQGPIVCTYTSVLAGIKGSLEKLCSFEKNVCSIQIQNDIQAVSMKLDVVTQKAESASIKGTP